MNYSAESQHNVAICQQAINELVLEYGGQEKCPWTLRPKKKYVCFLFHPVKSLGRVGRLSFFFYNLILTTNIQHIKVAHNLEHRSGISRHVV